MSVWNSFVSLFYSSNMISLCLWATGLILFCLEFFQPMRKICYATGMTLIAAAFCVCVTDGSPATAFAFVLVTAACLFCVHIVALATQKRLWLGVARIERASISRRKYDSLINGTGIANTPIDTTGNVTVNDVNLVVHSDSPIAAGERVKIVRVDKDGIAVEKLRDGDE